ncbi:Acetate/butyrate--CoA ligase aae7, peroxisomal [Trifolium repens]|nr:Acetate/butyrate--CoA ligase aae7, peroxisomal [Trifolium repens]
MPAYWVPKSVVVGPLPKTATGKWELGTEASVEGQGKGDGTSSYTTNSPSSDNSTSTIPSRFSFSLNNVLAHAAFTSYTVSESSQSNTFSSVTAAEIQQMETHKTSIHMVAKMILMKPFINMGHVFFLMMLLTASRMDVRIISFLNFVEAAWMSNSNV